MKCTGSSCKSFLQRYGDFLDDQEFIEDVTCENGICKLRSKYNEYICEDGKCRKIDKNNDLTYNKWIKVRENFESLLTEAQPTETEKLTTYNSEFRKLLTKYSETNNHGMLSFIHDTIRFAKDIGDKTLTAKHFHMSKLLYT